MYHLYFSKVRVCPVFTPLLHMYFGICMYAGYLSFFNQRQDVCMNDDEFVEEGDSESKLPPGVSGCPKPKAPANSYLRVRRHKIFLLCCSQNTLLWNYLQYSSLYFQINKRVYNYGDHEEFVCFTGFKMDGYQLIHCLQDGSWEKPRGQCLSKS